MTLVITWERKVYSYLQAEIQWSNTYQLQTNSYDIHAVLLLYTNFQVLDDSWKRSLSKLKCGPIQPFSVSVLRCDHFHQHAPSLLSASSHLFSDPHWNWAGLHVMLLNTHDCNLNMPLFLCQVFHHGNENILSLSDYRLWQVFIGAETEYKPKKKLTIEKILW